MYIGAPLLAPLTSTAFSAGVTNYVEITLEQDTGGADSKAFWNKTANGSTGGEFSQLIDTYIYTKAELVINDSNFTGDADKLPICEVVVDGGGTIIDIIDRRDLFYRLGKGDEVGFDHPWDSRSEPAEDEFEGADKSIASDKEWRNAVMSMIRELAGTDYWFESPAVALTDTFANVGLSVLTGITAGAKFGWSGTELSITDTAGGGDEDEVIALRLLADVNDLFLTRQSGGNAIALADGEVLWIEIPDPNTGLSYDAVGVTSSSYRVSTRGSIPVDHSTYWLAFREGTRIYLRGMGELEAGEEREVNDEIPQDLLTFIGSTSETDGAPAYANAYNVTQGQSLVTSIGKLDDAASDFREDRSAYLRSADEVTWTGTQLELTSSIVLEVINSKSGTVAQHNILIANSPILIADLESIYVIADRTSTSETLTVKRTTVDAIPAHLPANKDLFVLFRRVDSGTDKFLHLPFTKQMLAEGQVSRLGASGSGATEKIVRLYDRSYDLDGGGKPIPQGSGSPTATLDGVAVVNGDLVLSGGAPGNGDPFRVHKASGVGSSIVWTLVKFWKNFASEATLGESVRVQEGTLFATQLIVARTTTDFGINYPMKQFSATGSSSYIEFHPRTSATLTDNTTAGTVFSQATGSGTSGNFKNFIIEFSLIRDTTKEVGHIYLTSDGSAAAASVQSVSLGGANGVTFTADMSGANVRLLYTTTNTGVDGTVIYTMRKWQG